MAINADRIMPYLNRADLLVPSPHVNRIADFPRMPQQGRFQVEPKHQVVRISIESVIDQLDSIVEKSERKSISFHPLSLADDFEIKLGQKAKKLSSAIQIKKGRAPDTNAIQEAILFLGACGLILGLRKIIKTIERKQFGLNPPTLSKSDQIMLRRADIISESLLEDPSDEVLELAVDFIENNGFLDIEHDVHGDESFEYEPLEHFVSTRGKI